MIGSHHHRMKISRKLAWTVTPVVAAALSVGGVALASNAWHTSQTITAAGKAGSVQPVIATATVEDMYPGQPLKIDVHFNNPNNFPVNVLALQATTINFTDAAVYPQAAQTLSLHRSYGVEWDDSTTGPGSLSLPATAFDLGPSASVPAGFSDQVLTGTAVDASFADALQQGSPVSIDYWVDEAAF